MFKLFTTNGLTVIWVVFLFFVFSLAGPNTFRPQAINKIGDREKLWRVWKRNAQPEVICSNKMRPCNIINLFWPARRLPTANCVTQQKIATENVCVCCELWRKEMRERERTNLISGWFDGCTARAFAPPVCCKCENMFCHFEPFTILPCCPLTNTHTHTKINQR